MKTRYVWLMMLTSFFVELGCSQGPMNLQMPSNSLTDVDPYLDNPYEAAAMDVLQRNCVSCHTPTSGPSNVFDLTDGAHLVSAGLIVVGEPNSSTLYRAISSGAMPPSGSLSSTDQTALYNWIVTTGTLRPASTTN